MKRSIALIAALMFCIALPVMSGDLVKVVAETKTPAKTTKRRLYVPPTNLTPLREKTRVQSGATRGARSPTELRVLAPEHTGFTVKAQPTVYWYSSRPVNTPVEIVIETAEGELAPPILDRRLEPPFEAGLHAISLADLGVTLETGKEYAWRIIVVVDEKRRSNDVYAGANIARVSESAAITSAIATAPPGEHPRIYASAGLWYDALSAIEKLGHQAADRAGVLADCRELLDGQSLQDVSCP